jgi:O-methyltransferase
MESAASSGGLLARLARIVRGPSSGDRCGASTGAAGDDDVLRSGHGAGEPSIDALLAAVERQALRRAPGLLKALARGLDAAAGEDEKYRIAETLTSAVYPKYKFSEFARLFLDDEDFIAYYRRFMDPGNWHSLDRKYTLDQLLKLTLEIEGDAAECGVYKGASSYLICRAIRPYGKCNHVFDSFQGLSAPTDMDGAYWSAGALQATEFEVRENLREFGNFAIHAGWIPSRFEEVGARRFSFVHIDVDLYEPTRDSVAFFYERLTPGAIMLFDDYGFGTCPGAKLAVDEFLRERPERTVMLPTGQAFLVKRGGE